MKLGIIGTGNALCGPTASGGVVCTLAPEGKLTDLVLPQQNASPG